MIHNVISTTAPGINASKERATAGGTCSGILIVIFLLVKKRYTSTEKIIAKIPENMPEAPNDAIGKTNPNGASAGVVTFTGICNMKKAPKDNTPPVVGSSL